MIDFLAGIHVPAETLWTGVVAIITALLGSGALVAWLNRGMSEAQRQQLQDKIAAGLRADLLDADTNCDKRIQLLEAGREKDRKDCDERLRALEQKLDAALAWGHKAETDSCEARKKMQAEIDQLRLALADERELRIAREDEMTDMVRGMEAQ